MNPYSISDTSHLRATIILLAIFVLGWQPVARAEVPTWLSRMVQAKTNHDFTGTLVYMGDGALESALVIHRKNKDGSTARFISLNGPWIEIHRTNDRLIQVLPSKNKVVDGGRWPAPFDMALRSGSERLSHHYRFEEAGTDRVAMRPCLRTVVKSIDDLRFSYKLCLDQETGLLLDVQVIDTDGSIRQQVMFTQLHLGPPKQGDVPAELDISQFRHQQSNAETAMTAGEEQSWRIDTLPAGFVITSARQGKAETAQATMTHLILSDGLASVSVFINTLTDKPALTGAMRKGVLNAYGCVNEGMQITAVGEVPIKTLEMIGLSLHRVGFVPDGTEPSRTSATPGSK